jgi:ATP-binding cassette subfamily B (MDR/TAP) protein 1
MISAGTHEELLSNPNGAYSQLVHLQQIYKHQDKDLGLKPELDTCVSDNFMHGDLQRSSDHSSSGARNIIVNSPRNSVTVAEGAAVFRRGGQGEDGPQAAAKKIIRRADTSVFRLAALNKPELPLFIVGSIAAAANGTAFPVFGLLLSNVISSFYLPNKHKLRHDANFWSLMYVVLAVGIFIVAPAQSFSFGLIGQRLICRLRRMTFDKVLRQEIAWFDVDENSR